MSWIDKQKVEEDIIKLTAIFEYRMTNRKSLFMTL